MRGFDTLRAALARDGEASPQARDEREDAWGTTLDVDRQTPDRGDIEDWTKEYEENVLIRKPVQTYASDVLEPGYRCKVGSTDEDAPEVPTSYPDPDYHGLTIDDALEKWLSEAGIVDGEFNRDFESVLDKYLKDKIGRRGTPLVEIAYDDASEKDYILGLRPIKVETVTAYTREGKSILLRPDDTAEDVSFEESESGDTRDTLPETKAGDTACYVQFDDVFGTRESDEVRLSQEDVVKDAYDADTGEVFGLPDTASVYDRASSIRQQYNDLDQALKAVAYSHFVVQVETSKESEAKEILDGFDPSNPEKANVVNYGVEVDHYSGEIPDIDATLKQEIEYILSAFPVPMYRIGFEGDINRDVTSEQGDDYLRVLSDERDRIESAFKPVLERKAEEFLDGERVPDVELEIRPEEDENPLHDEEFDAGEFKKTMDALNAAGVTLPKEYVLETFLGVDADEIDELEEEVLPEDDPRVRESFQNVTGEQPAEEQPAGD